MRVTSTLVALAAVVSATAIALPEPDPAPAAVVTLENRAECSGCRKVQFGKCPGGANVLFVPDCLACYVTAQGECPNTPWDVRKVKRPYVYDYQPGCYDIENGRCPGGDNVKWVTSLGFCAYITRGKCPGGVNHVWVGEPWRG